MVMEMTSFFLLENCHSIKIVLANIKFVSANFRYSPCSFLPNDIKKARFYVLNLIFAGGKKCFYRKKPDLFL